MCESLNKYFELYILNTFNCLIIEQNESKFDHIKIL